MPGIFVFYDLSPIKVRIVEDGNRLSGFLTSVCAIVGGIFTVMSLLDGAMHSWFKRLGRDRIGSGLLDTGSSE